MESITFPIGGLVSGRVVSLPHCPHAEKHIAQQGNSRNHIRDEYSNRFFIGRDPFCGATATASCQLGEQTVSSVGFGMKALPCYSEFETILRQIQANGEKF